MEKHPPVERPIVNQFTRRYVIIFIIPIIILLILVLSGAILTRSYFADLITKSNYELNSDAKRSLQQLGEEIIINKARDVAMQAEIYFLTHPGTDITRMRQDPRFMAFALQKVGKTGYTSFYEAGTWIFRVHPNQKLIDRNVKYLAADLPSWWSLVGATHSGNEVFGYYDWRDPDGTIRKKFMCITPVKTKLDHKIIMVAATTYIDEFSLPVNNMKQKANAVVKNYQQYVSRQMLLFGGIVGFIILLTYLGTYFLGKWTGLRYIEPITQLADTARELGNGKWDFQIPDHVFQRRDEIGVMAQSFFKMSQQLKDSFSSLEQRVTELHQAQAALKVSEEHYRGLFDGIPVGLFRTTSDGKFLDVNPAFVAMLGYPNRQTLLDKSAQAIYVHSDDRNIWTSMMKDSGGVHAYDVLIRKYDGVHIWAANSSRTVYDETGRVLYFEGSLIDTTERRLADEAVKKSEANFKALYEESRRSQEVYRSLINSSADAIVICSLEKQITYISPMFTAIFGWPPEDILGGPIPFESDSSLDDASAAIDQVIISGIPCHGKEARRLTKEGKSVDISLSISRYNDHEGQPAGILMILRDISAAKQMEEHLQQVERLEAIATLAGGIAHDFNNLLMVIQGTISLLLYATHESDPLYKHFVNIEKQVNRGSRLTKQLLGYARKGKYDIRPLSINDVIAECLETLRQTRKDIRIHNQLSDRLSVVEADIYQMEQVFMNLFINASDAMDTGGDLTVFSCDISATDIPDRLRENRTGSYILITVEDTGIGMEKKIMDRIFEPFFTTKEVNKGTGLGLASVYGIIRSHGGVIDVFSEPGIGTKFLIYLPASDKEAPVHIAERKKALDGRGTLLIIDDEKPVLDVTSDILSSVGYTILKADSGRTGIDLYCREQNRIDLVILDMVMPDMSGGDVFDILREINPDVAVLLSSGYSLDGRAGEILNRGCKGFIQKPFSMEDLAEKVNRIVRKNKSGPSA